MLPVGYAGTVQGVCPSVDRSSDSKAAQLASLISTAFCFVFWAEGELNYRCL